MVGIAPGLVSRVSEGYMEVSLFIGPVDDFHL
jgi:hypothetical protein